MTIRQKLEIIQKMLGLTQTRLAERFGVSFATLNSWWNEKSIPRTKKQTIIDDLFLEVTGQKVIPVKQLLEKKERLIKKSAQHKNIVLGILAYPDIRDELILKLTYNSNKIEGSTLSEDDTASIIFDNIVLHDKSLTEHLEAKNHQVALNRLFRHIATKQKIDENLILNLHGILMNGINSDAGQYRQHGVRIVGANMPTANYLKIPELMKSLVLELQVKSKDIIGLVTEIHSRFEQIHPFSDGNGRVGRLLMNAMLLHSNMAPAIIRQEQKRLYYTYLNKSQVSNEYTQLEDYICDAIADGFGVLERTEINN